MKEKLKLEEKTNEFHSRETLLADASDMLERNMVEKLGEFYPDEIRAQNLAHTTVRLDLLQAQSMAIKQLEKVFLLCKVHDGEGTNRGLSSDYHQICGVHLPQGINPHSDSVEELGASLGYMFHLLNLVVHYLQLLEVTSILFLFHFKLAPFQVKEILGLKKVLVIMVWYLSSQQKGHIQMVLPVATSSMVAVLFIQSRHVQTWRKGYAF
ncbi:hypothetical protein SUGI_0524000 [Cryptomeria japonica]|nr:hypothetical protein SUGI_0524000 [Cryptomeria japonica]